MMRKIFLGAAVVCASACIALASPAGKPTFGTWGVDLSGMDNSVKPGDDFFLYANGAWLARTEIPADRTSIGSFQNLQILSEKRMKELVEKGGGGGPARLQIKGSAGLTYRATGLPPGLAMPCRYRSG